MAARRVCVRTCRSSAKEGVGARDADAKAAKAERRAEAAEAAAAEQRRRADGERDRRQAETGEAWAELGRVKQELEDLKRNATALKAKRQAEWTARVKAEEGLGYLQAEEGSFAGAAASGHPCR